MSDAVSSISVLGLPWDKSSSFLRGAEAAPAAIRAALAAESGTLTDEAGRDLGPSLRVRPDLCLAPNTWREEVAAGATAALSTGPAIFLGGDHSVTFPILQAVHQRHGAVHLIHIDAHPDLYDRFDDDPYSHACPFARIMEEGLAVSLTQLGIRATNAHQVEQARRFGVRQWPIHEAPANAPLPAGPCYLSIDLDGIDPAFCPGVSHREPGGLSVREVLNLIRRLKGPLVGADVVEYNPSRDVQDQTAHVAAKLVKALAGRMHGAGEPGSGPSPSA